MEEGVTVRGKKSQINLDGGVKSGCDQVWRITGAGMKDTGKKKRQE